MSVSIQTKATEVVPDQTGQRLDPHRRWIEAWLADPAIGSNIPPDALFYLLLDDDPAFVEGEIAAGVAALRRGQDVYFRHIHAAVLPPLRPVQPGPHVGEQWVTYDRDGSIVANRIFGADGQWHDTDQPPPGPRDDDPAELFP